MAGAWNAAALNVLRDVLLMRQRHSHHAALSQPLGSGRSTRQQLLGLQGRKL